MTPRTDPKWGPLDWALIATYTLAALAVLLDVAVWRP